MTPVVGWLEKLTYGACGVDPDKDDMGWKAYTLNLLVFSLVGFLVLYLISIYQNLLPLNPQKLPGLSPDLSFDTAASFITNTNWQSYAGESAMSYFSQMVGLTVQNFMSPAVGLAVMVALIRGLSRKSHLESVTSGSI